MTATENSTTAAAAQQIPIRLDFDAHAAGFARAMAELDRAAIKELDAAGIDPLLRELVRVRASQLNGCAYYIDMHTKDARAAGRYCPGQFGSVPFWSHARPNAGQRLHGQPHSEKEGGRRQPMLRRRPEPCRVSPP